MTVSLPDGMPRQPKRRNGNLSNDAIMAAEAKQAARCGSHVVERRAPDKLLQQFCTKSADVKKEKNLHNDLASFYRIHWSRNSRNSHHRLLSAITGRLLGSSE